MMKIIAVLLLELVVLACHNQSKPFSLAPSQSAPNPFRAMHFPVGTHPTMPTVADVNKDGNLDIIVANGGSGNVSVYLGDGKGAFTQADGSPFQAGQNPADITTADFNDDGNLDLAIANHS